MAGIRMNGHSTKHEMTDGEDRMQINLSAYYLGRDIIIQLYNNNAHLGTVAMGEYDHEEARASVSVITRPGHRDNVIAQKIALMVSKQIKGPTCVIAGIHIDNITKDEIDQIIKRVDLLTVKLCKQLSQINTIP